MRLAELNNVTDYMGRYDAGTLENIEQAASVSLAFYFLTMGAGSASLLVMILTTFSMLFVGMQRYRWRPGLHTSWCVHSCFMSMLLISAGFLLPFTVTISEGCETVKAILATASVSSLIVPVYTGRGGWAGCRELFQR